MVCTDGLQNSNVSGQPPCLWRDDAPFAPGTRKGAAPDAEVPREKGNHKLRYDQYKNAGMTDKNKEGRIVPALRLKEKENRTL